MTRPTRVLLVEDESIEVQAYEDYLENMLNYKLVGVADNGKTAMQLVIDETPDVVVLDFTLRGSVGSSIIKSIRSADLSIQPLILVISSSIASWKKKDLIKMGANECFIKGAICDNPPMVFEYINDFFESFLEETNQKAKIMLNIAPKSEVKNRLVSRIKADLERMGIQPGRKAYGYIIHILESCVTEKNKNPIMQIFYDELAKLNRCAASSVERAVDNGIAKAFNADFYEGTIKIYTAEYAKGKDKPSVREFVCFFLNKYIDEGY